MEVLITILCSVMIVLALFLIVAVLMQSGKETGLSGTIAGGAETFFGKTKGKTIDRALSKATTVVAIIFVILVLTVYVLQGVQSKNSLSSSQGVDPDDAAVETVTEEEPAETAEETVTADEAPAETVEETATAEKAAD